ncbi:MULTISPECIES: hypothetical protein [Nostoc]|uniref:Uncharacterized protein n=2 Tax=Nostoc TaxID=1177 RepID=A0ABR8IFL0_9NOSO|nr:MULTISPECIES: hypothetical protein [Nostoc]MBD2562361.1 hypothetical protein [Nostoc linckia FACHB-391]MBD2649761.1 hypothetical protein [Nostoc foliaceum FACHB-393]
MFYLLLVIGYGLAATYLLPLTHNQKKIYLTKRTQRVGKAGREEAGRASKTSGQGDKVNNHAQCPAAQRLSI